MASQKLTLTRTSYTDPSQATNPTRQSGVQDAEALVDYTLHDKPLEQIHASNLHGWGIASGLTVTATLGGPNLQVLPGVAVDSLGQHISLAFGGFAQSTANPDKVGDTTRLPVTNPTGVTIPTPAPGGTMYLTIQFLESFDLDSLIGQGVFQMYHSPWLQLVATAGFVNDGTSLVLAQVTIDGAGHVTSLSAGLRQGTSLALQRLSVGNYGFQSAGGASIGASIPEIGALQPRAAGGLTIVTDALGLQTSGGGETVAFNAANGQATLAGLNVSGDVRVVGNLTVNGTLSGVSANAVGALPASGAIPQQTYRLRVPLFTGTMPGSPPWTVKSETQLTANVNVVAVMTFPLQLPHKATVTKIELDLIPAPPLQIIQPGTNIVIGQTISLIQFELFQVNHDTDVQTTLAGAANQSLFPQLTTGPLNLTIDNQSFSYYIHLLSTPIFPPFGPVSTVTATKLLISYRVDTLF